MNAQSSPSLTLGQQSILDDCRRAVLDLLADACREFGIRNESTIEAMQRAARQRFDELAGLRDRKTFDALRSITASRISLVHEDDLEFSIRLSDLAQYLRDRSEQALGQLHLRFMTLLGQQDVADEQLPPGPETICAGLKALCEEGEYDADARVRLLQEIRPLLIRRLNDFYPQLNARLEGAGVQPKTLLRNAADDRPSRPGPTIASANTASTEGSAGANLDGKLAVALRDRMIAWLEDQLRQDAGNPQIARQFASSDLAPLLPDETREGIASVEAALKRVTQDKRLAEPARAVLEGLRAPLLKLALREPTFVFDPQHPARRLVDALAREAIELPTDVVAGTTQLNLIEATVARLAREYVDDAQAFANVLATLEQARSERLGALTRRVEGLADAIRNEERSEAARRYASKAIRALCAQEPPATVRIFLERYWSLVLRRVLLSHGDKSDEWKQALRVADSLIWSMQPKNEAGERNRLVSLLPNLVQHLRTGLDAIGVSEASRDKLLARFTAMHTEALHGKDPRASEPEIPPTEADASRIDTSPHAANLRLLRRPGYLPREAVPPEAFARLAPGDALELRLPDGSTSSAVIAGIGPLRQIFVLQLRPSNELLGITAVEMARQAEMGELSLRQAPLTFED